MKNDEIEILEDEKPEELDNNIAIKPTTTPNDTVTTNDIAREMSRNEQNAGIIEIDSTKEDDRNLLNSSQTGNNNLQEIENSPKKNSTTKIVIIIILTIIAFVLIGNSIIHGLLSSSNSYYDKIKEEMTNSDTQDNDNNGKSQIDNGADYEQIAGYSFTATDKSLIYFKSDKTFIWYRNKDNQTDNYYEGTYTVYKGDNALNYISESLTEYGLTKDEQQKIITSRSTTEINAKETYYNINLLNTKIVTNGIAQTINKSIHYYGFLLKDQKTLDFVNMQTASPVIFVRN